MIRPTRPALAAVAALLGALAPATSLAQNPRAGTSNGEGFDTHLFRPAVDSKGFFSVNGAEVLGANDISFGLVTDYGHQLLRLSPGHGQDAMITHAFQGTLGISYGLFNRLVVGVSTPVVLQTGDELLQVGPPANLYDTGKLDQQQFFTHVAAHAKVKIVRNEDALGVAVLVQAGVPTSADPAKELGAEPKPWYWPQLILEKDIGQGVGLVRIGANAGYRGGGMSQRTTFDQLKAGNFEASKALYTGSAAISVRVLEPLDLVVETYATKQADGNSSSKASLSQEVVGGIKVFVEKNSYLAMGAGVRVGDGYEAASQRGFIGFIFEPSIGDRDGDGIPDDIDQCPDEPEDKDGFKDSDGCPDPDNDNDGIPDKRDACPNQPETKNGYKDEDGCPDVDMRDRDGDGILDKDDKCPDEPEDKDGFEDSDGCPDPDNDKDGVLDVNDGCPNDPEDKDGFEDEDGCPDPDNDKDGIPDTKDKCPNEPETFNGFEDEDGCPDKGKVIIEGNNVIILEKIQFETGSAKIRKESNGILEAVASTLKGHPEFELLEVQGHADERGGDAMNLKLTDARAHAVMEALVARGVEAKRLQAVGYGEYCPIDHEKTAKAFEKNRRVEFKVVINAGESTGVELGCAEAKKHGVESPRKK
jgi:outer membrane protein OmpA-like peptidoglycan-associated protein